MRSLHKDFHLYKIPHTGQQMRMLTLVCVEMPHKVPELMQPVNERKLAASMQGFADLDDLLAEYGNGTVRICRPTDWLGSNYSAAVSPIQILLLVRHLKSSSLILCAAPVT